MATPPLATFLPQSSEFTNNVARIYSRLDVSKRQIRVFRIHRAQDPDPNEPVSVELHTASLDDKDLTYNALSYTWELNGEHRQVLVGGFTYNVTINQEAALKRFRSVPGLDLLWMDVLCINQLDLAERSQQVGIMRQIYSRSERTHIWLGVPPDQEQISDALDWEAFLETDTVRDKEALLRGTPTPDRPWWLNDLESGSRTLTEAAFAILDALSNGVPLRQMPFFYRDEKGKIQLIKAYYSAIAMVSLMLTSKWFRRVWTIQEAVLSPNPAIVHFGSSSKFFWIFLRAFERIERDMSESSEYLVTWMEMWLGGPVMLFHDGLLRVGELNLAHSLANANSQQIFLSMLPRLHREATDARDHVYGLLGFMPDADFEISYTSSVAKVFARAVLFAEKTSEGTGKWLLIDARGVSGSPNPHGIPSWVPDLTWSMGLNREPNYGFGTNLVDHVVENLDWSRVSFDPTCMSLSIPSVRMDVVDIVPDYPIIPDNERRSHFVPYFVKRLERIFGRHPCVGDRNALWRTAIHDRPELDDATLFALKDIESCVHHESQGGCTDQRHNMIDNWVDSKSEQFHLVATRDGRLASVRPSAKVGDEIHLIMGCPLPIILRPIDAEFRTQQMADAGGAVTKASETISRYQVVGSGYVEDLMLRDGSRYRFEESVELV